MSGSNVSVIFELPGLLGGYILHVTKQTLLAPGATFSITSLLCAFVVAGLFLLFRRRRRLSLIRLRAVVRALLPRRWAFSRSSQTDFGFLLLNNFVLGAIIGQALLSYTVVSNGLNTLLVSGFGQMPVSTLPPLVTMLIITVALFLAYELGYWIDHYLSHKVPFLWEFHKVHHAAEVLTPLTNARVHPVDSLVFLNILGVVIGVTNGSVIYLLGQTPHEFTIAGGNAITVVFTYLVAHLQHSHVWIAFTGTLGKLLLSPAHHQIHHSMRPEHHDRNFGSCIAVFDWAFGTLVVPRQAREQLRFGVEAFGTDPHSIRGSLIDPFVRALELVAPGHSSEAAGRAGPGRVAG